MKMEVEWFLTLEIQTGSQLFLCTMFIFGIKNIWIEFWYLFTAANSVAAEAKTKELPEYKEL